jgi:hypothetical protein
MQLVHKLYKQTEIELVNPRSLHAAMALHGWLPHPSRCCHPSRAIQANSHYSHNYKHIVLGTGHAEELSIRLIRGLEVSACLETVVRPIFIALSVIPHLHRPNRESNAQATRTTLNTRKDMASLHSAAKPRPDQRTSGNSGNLGWR